MNCCNGNGWYTSWSGGFAHPMPCKYCNRDGRPPSIRFDSHKTKPLELTEFDRLKTLVEAKKRQSQEADC